MYGPFATADKICLSRKGFPPARINIVGKTFAKHLGPLKCNFPVKSSPPSRVWWVGVLRTGSHPDRIQPCACPLTLSYILHYTHFQLFGWLSWLKRLNRPNGHKLPEKRILLTSSWAILMELDPSHPSCSTTSWGWFNLFTVSAFDLRPMMLPTKAQDGNFGDGSQQRERPAFIGYVIEDEKLFPS